MRKKLGSLLCGALAVACLLASGGTVYQAFAEEAETGSEEHLEERSETTNAESSVVPTDGNWLSLGKNPVSTGEAEYLFRPDYTGHYQFECSYMLSAHVKDPDGHDLQGEQCLETLSGLPLEAGTVYRVETSTASDEATLLIREVVSEVGVGKHQLERSGLYLFSPEEEGYYSVNGTDFEAFTYVYDDFEGEWYEKRISQPEHCYLVKQNYYIWVQNAPAELEISHAGPRLLQEGSNPVSDGWYQFVPKSSGFYRITNLREMEGCDDAWFCYPERPKYGFAGAEGYYLYAGQSCRIYYEGAKESTICRITNVRRSKEGLDYFVDKKQAMVIGYAGANTLVWPERIEKLPVGLANNDLHTLFHRADDIVITFPASMMGFRFDISYEWNEWKNDNPSVVSMKHLTNDPNGFRGQLVLKNSGTANILLIAGDAEEPSHEHRYSIRIEKAKNANGAVNTNTNAEREENKPDRSEKGGSGHKAPNRNSSGIKANGEEPADFTTEVDEAETESAAASSDTEAVEDKSSVTEEDKSSAAEDEAASAVPEDFESPDAPADGEASLQESHSGMRAGGKALAGVISGLALLLVVFKVIAYYRQAKP